MVICSRKWGIESLQDASQHAKHPEIPITQLLCRECQVRRTLSSQSLSTECCEYSRLSWSTRADMNVSRKWQRGCGSFLVSYHRWGVDCSGCVKTSSFTMFTTVMIRIDLQYICVGGFLDQDAIPWPDIPVQLSVGPTPSVSSTTGTLHKNTFFVKTRKSMI